MVITLEIERIGSLLWDAVVLWLLPFVVKREDIRLVLIKDRVDDSSHLTHFIVQPLELG